MRGLGLCLVLVFASLANAQVVLNGSFEENIFVPPYGINACNFDNPCDYYHQKMAHSNAWETMFSGEQHLCFIGVMKEGCTQGPDSEHIWGPAPPDGDWSVLIYGQHYEPSGSTISGHLANAISLALSEPLEVGKSYALSYYILASPPSLVPEYVVYNTAPLNVGISETDTVLGQHIHSSIFPDSVWRRQSLIFEASIPAQHLTFQINTPSPQTDVVLRYLTLLDNVSLSTELGVFETAKAQTKLYPNPFTDIIHIESSGVRLAFYDVLGKLQRQHSLAPNEKTSVDVSDLPMGIYVLKVFDAFGQELGSEKLVKTHRQ